MLLSTTRTALRSAVGATRPMKAPSVSPAMGVRYLTIDQITPHLPTKPRPPHMPQTRETPRKSWRHMPVPKYPTQEGRIEDYEVLGQEEGEEQQEAPPSEHPQKDQLPYGVHRSRMLDLHPATQASRELPVYVKYQKIRSRVQTEIKHIYGDVEAMEKDLRETLPSLAKEIEAGPTPGQVLRAKYFGKSTPPLTTAVYGALGLGFAGRGNVGKKSYGAKPRLDVPRWIQQQVHPDVLKERSGRILIRGNRVAEVKKWLRERGF